MRCGVYALCAEMELGRCERGPDGTTVLQKYNTLFSK